jgi:hypothetical protein
MIDCLLLKSMLNRLSPRSAGGVSYTSQNLCQDSDLNLFIKSSLNLLHHAFESFDPTALRGGHSSDFQRRVKRCFASFLHFALNHPRAAFAPPRRHGAHYREFLKPCNTLFKKSYTFKLDSVKFNRNVLFFNIYRIILQQQRKFLCH